MPRPSKRSWRHRVGQPVLRWIFGSFLDRLVPRQLSRWYAQRSSALQGFLVFHEVYWPRHARPREWDIRLFCGRTVTLNDGGNAGARQLALQYRLMEPEVKQCLVSLMSRDQRPWVIDGGANVGQMSIDALGLERRVLMIEPDPETVQALKTLVAAFPDAVARITANALGERAQLSRLQRLANSDMNRLVDNAVGDDAIAVEVARLDDLLQQQSIAPTDVALFKLDVEGAEPAALRGAVKLLTEGRPALLVELLDPPSRVELAIWLQSLGYRAHRIGVVDGQFSTLTPVEPDALRQCWDRNYCFLPMNAEACA